ncbi:hypothetical protein L3Y25_gp008 [Gordonia phage Syleon]|uniref:Uncharacterized protein n=1 Tax=Gordonia phage Syleon TaxID=2653718 RepID=A0A5Q2WGR8_9CAUD|nr:hypothetical protein L3Y25_gp008 [Gordonia phage Syleon]QGH75737.1 hypothetical protein SEA_SYLEON_8 [Gordonia phage Syleon]
MSEFTRSEKRKMRKHRRIVQEAQLLAEGYGRVAMRVECEALAASLTRAIGDEDTFRGV